VSTEPLLFVLRAVAIPCKAPLFSCNTYPRCAMMAWVLDGEDDCLDGTDEGQAAAVVFSRLMLLLQF